MTASIGIWAQGDPSDESVLYRWEADQQTGYVTIEVPTRRFRPGRRQRSADRGSVLRSRRGRAVGRRRRRDQRLRSGGSSRGWVDSSTYISVTSTVKPRAIVAS